MSENSGLTHAKDCDACSLWKDVPLHNFLTYMDVFAWKCSHKSTRLHTTYHIISYVLSRPPCFHAVCWLPDVFMCMFAHYKTSVRTLFWLMKSCLCVTLNISHLVCNIIFHRCTRNKVPRHDFLTYEPFSLCNFWLTRTYPCANCHIWGSDCLQRVTKFLTFYLDHQVSTHSVDYVTCSCACSRTKKTYVCTLFELERRVHA